MPIKTRRRVSKIKSRNPKKRKDTAQDKRIKKLEDIVYPALDWKTNDKKAVQADITNAGRNVGPMFSLSKGTNDNQRAGDKVSLRHGSLNLSLTRGDTSNIIRVLIVKTPSSTSLTLSDVLEYHSFTTDGELVFSSPYQVTATDKEKTYTVMYDKVFQLKNDMSTLTKKIKLNLPKSGVSADFVGDGDVAPNNYNISLLMISDSTAAPHPTASYIMRWKYIDL